MWWRMVLLYFSLLEKGVAAEGRAFLQVDKARVLERKIPREIYASSNLSLSDLIAYDDLFREQKGSYIVKQSEPWCYSGSYQQVCSIFRKLSRRAVTEYEDGLHYLTQLNSCWQKKDNLYLKLVSRHDWEEERPSYLLKLKKCLPRTKS